MLLCVANRWFAKTFKLILQTRIHCQRLSAWGSIWTGEYRDMEVFGRGSNKMGEYRKGGVSRCSSCTIIITWLNMFSHVRVCACVWVCVCVCLSVCLCMCVCVSMRVCHLYSSKGWSHFDWSFYQLSDRYLSVSCFALLEIQFEFGDVITNIL